VQTRRVAIRANALGASELYGNDTRMVDELLRGNDQFQISNTDEERAFLSRLASEGQSPGALFIGCSDSRVVPEILTESSPGDLFVVRNVANIVPPFGHERVAVAAALDYAVAVLEVPHIIVCGHHGCGGVDAALGGLAAIQHLPSLCEWLSEAEAAMATVRDEAKDQALDHVAALRLAVEHNTLLQVARLMSYPLVSDAVAEGRLSLHAWIYDIHTLGVLVYDAAAGKFAPTTAVL
jgi:carbonic anhydrase